MKCKHFIFLIFICIKKCVDHLAFGEMNVAKVPDFSCERFKGAVNVKSYLGFFLLFIIGLSSAYIIGFQSYSPATGLAYDDEQKGLNDQIVIKFSHVVAENTPKGIAAQKFAELVQEKTNNKVKVEVFSNGSLYSDKEELLALQQNSVQMIAPATSKLTESYPTWQVLDLPYVFPTSQSIKEALSGEIGEELLKELEKEEIKGLTFWSNGFKQMTSNSLITKPEDLEGKNFRIMPSNVIEAQFDEFGAKASVLPFNQTFPYLESKKIDGQENTISNIYSKKIYEVQKYMTISNHGYLGYAVLINNKFWNNLPKEIQRQILDALNETSEWLWETSEELNKAQLAKIKENSTIEIYVLSNEERREWMEKFSPIYKQFEDEIGSDLLNKISRLRNKYLLNE